MNKNFEDHFITHDGMSPGEGHGLHGHVQIFRTNKETGEKSLWFENDNVITISGMQWILMKMFDLHLDSNHNNGTESLTQDTNVEIPDLNKDDQLKLGVATDSYSAMLEDLPSNHFIQGFMIGCGGAAEDGITTKNTDYSFIKLRQPVPFRITSSPITSGKYLGIMRETSAQKKYFIKKFDSRPHIYHGWWTEGERWDNNNPVTSGDLGPNTTNGTPTSNRIESYVECEMSLDADDCVAYFNAANATAQINELGLVAYDTTSSQRTSINTTYTQHIVPWIRTIFDNSKDSQEDLQLAYDNCSAAMTVLSYVFASVTPPDQISGLMEFMETYMENEEGASSRDESRFEAYQQALSAGGDSNITVEALYNVGRELVSTTDNFLTIMDDVVLTTDEAQRIKMITYYTFKSLPLQSNYTITINYRIYAN